MADNPASEAGSSTKTSKPSKRVSDTPRKRVSQACDRCRARKDKCDGLKPVCSTCAAQDAPCNYDSNTKKRGLPEGYVRGLEKLWGLSIREVEDIEESVITALSNESIAETWNDAATETETLQETWRNSRISRELERLLPLLDIEDKPSAKRKRDAPRTESMSGTRPTLRTISTGQEGSARVVDQSQPSSNDPRVPDPLNIDPHLSSSAEVNIAGRPVSNTRGTSGDTANAMSLELPARTFQLIDIYFSYTHSWFPILEKYDIVRFSHQYATAILDTAPASVPTKPSASGNNAVLWALLAYTDQQRRSIQQDQQDPAPGKIYEYARSLIPGEEGALDIGHVQALLLLTLYCMGCGRWRAAWSLIGQSARYAIELGFGDTTRPSSKRSQHVFLGCFALDTLIAARLQRRPQLRREELKEMRVEEDGLEEWDPAPDCLNIYKQASRGPAGILSTFNKLINVLSILNDVICGTSSTNSQHTMVEMEVLDRLPAQFAPTWSEKRMDSTQLILPHQYHLHAAYIVTSTVLHLHARQQSNRSVDQIASSTLQQIAKLLTQHSQHFGLQILPSIYEYYVFIASKCAVIDQNPHDKHRADIQHSLIDMNKTWPTYASVQQSFHSPSNTSHQRSEVATYQQQFQRPVIPREVTAQAPAPALIPDGRPIIHSAAFNIPSVPDHHRSGSMSTLSVGDQEPLNRFGKSPSINLSSLQGLSPNTSFMPQTPLGNVSWSTTTPGGAQDSFPLTTQTSQAFEGSSNLDIDGDSMFNEFAALDAMEWTNNWDQSLLNLGFTDPTSMNQDFYAFCREPDPLYPSGLVQQLLSSNMGVGNMGNGNPENGGTNMNAHIHAPVTTVNGNIAGGMAMPGNIARFDVALDFNNPHVEAGQILQRLASGMDGVNKSR